MKKLVALLCLFISYFLITNAQETANKPVSVTERVLSELAEKWSQLDTDNDGFADSDFYSVDSENNLTEISVNGNYIKALDGDFDIDLSDCSRLITLDLWANDLDDFSSDFSDCISLQTLELSYCELTNISLDLMDCPDLSYLGLAHNNWQSFELFINDQTISSTNFDDVYSEFSYGNALKQFLSEVNSGYFAYVKKYDLTEPESVIYTPSAKLTDDYDLSELSGDTEDVFALNDNNELLLMDYSDYVVNKSVTLNMTVMSNGEQVVPAVMVVDLYNPSDDVRRQIAESIGELDGNYDNLADEKYFVFDEYNNITSVYINAENFSADSYYNLTVDFTGCYTITTLDFFNSEINEFNLNLQSLDELSYFDIEGNPVEKLMLLLPYSEIETFYATTITYGETQQENINYAFANALSDLNTTEPFFFKYVKKPVFDENELLLNISSDYSYYSILGGNTEYFTIDASGNLTLDGYFSNTGAFFVSVEEVLEFETIATGRVMVEREEDQYCEILRALLAAYPQLITQPGYDMYAHKDYLDGDGLVISAQWMDYEEMFPETPLSGTFNIDFSEYEDFEGLVLDGNNISGFAPVFAKNNNGTNEYVRIIYLPGNEIAGFYLNMARWTNFRFLDLSNNPLESILITLPEHILEEYQINNQTVNGINIKNTNLPESAINAINELNNAGNGGLYGYKKFEDDVIAGTTVFETLDGMNLQLTNNDNNWFETLEGRLLFALNSNEITQQIIELSANITDESGTVISSGIICIELTNTTSIADNYNDKNKVYPTITTGEVTIEANPDNYNQIEFISVDGRVLNTYDMNTASRIFNLADFGKGIYFVRLSNNKGLTDTQKIILR